MRSRVRFLGLVFVILLWGCVASPEAELVSARGLSRPNIILITAEDMSPRVGFMGDRVAVTPNVDALARESVVFTRAFTTAGVCAPARSALITGAHQTSIGTMHMRTSSYGKDMDHGAPYETVTPPDVKAFPELLRAAGYYTVNDQKTDYQFGDPFTVWDQNRNGADWNARQPGQPFFAMINHEVTHEGRTWPPDTDPSLHPNVASAAARNGKLDATKLFQLSDPATVQIPPYWPDTPVVRQNLARFYDNIRVMDDEVGALLARLRAEGRFEDSIIIFTTDHGDGLPRHKRTIFDSGTHVPLIIRFPDGYGAGTKRDDLVSFIDLAPTILKLAGVVVPEYVDGRDIFSERAPEAIFMAGDRFDEVTQRFRGVREERWHYIRYYSELPIIPSLVYQNVNPIMREMRRLHAVGKLTPLQASYLDPLVASEFLFDTENDPYEIRNLAGDPEFLKVKQRLAARLDSWLSQNRDLGAIPEAQLVEEMWPGGVQPVTSMPQGCKAPGGAIRLLSSTRGASIAWGGDRGERSLYVRPLRQSNPFKARAIRYGYRRSEIATIMPNELPACR